MCFLLGCLFWVQRIMELESSAEPPILQHVEEAGFNLAKTRRGGRNVIGNRATVQIPRQRGANITMCAAIWETGAVAYITIVGPYNSARLTTFLDELQSTTAVWRQAGCWVNSQHYAVIWDNVPFHHPSAVRDCFRAHLHMFIEFLPPYSPFLNSIEEFISAWKWKVYDDHLYEQMPLSDAMTEAYHSIRLPMLDQACPEIFPTLHYQGKYYLLQHLYVFTVELLCVTVWVSYTILQHVFIVLTEVESFARCVGIMQNVLAG